MAIKIRCSECDKRIVIDEAFAGGACRCPFCSAIVMVPGGSGATAAVRPDAPGDRPSEPGAAPAVETVSAKVDPRTVPMAKADRTVTYILFGAVALLVLAVIAGVVMVVVSSTPATKPAANVAPAVEEEEAPVAEVVDPFKIVVQGPAVAGDVQITPPVVYVVDGGQQMSPVFDYAIAATRVSILTLKPEDTFTAIISASTRVASDGASPADVPATAPEPAPASAPEPSTTTAVSTSTGPSTTPATTSGPAQVVIRRVTGTDLLLPGGYIGGGDKGEQAFASFIEKYQGVDVPHGKSDVLPSLDAALALKPKTIILFTLKDFSGSAAGLSPEAQALAEKARAQGTSIVTIGLGADSSAQQSLQKLSKACGGESRYYPFDRLKDWADAFYNQMTERGTN